MLKYSEENKDRGEFAILCHPHRVRLVYDRYPNKNKCDVLGGGGSELDSRADTFKTISGHILVDTN